MLVLPYVLGFLHHSSVEVFVCWLGLFGDQGFLLGQVHEWDVVGIELLAAGGRASRARFSGGRMGATSVPLEVDLGAVVASARRWTFFPQLVLSVFLEDLSDAGLARSEGRFLLDRAGIFSRRVLLAEAMLLVR